MIYCSACVRALGSPVTMVRSVSEAWGSQGGKAMSFDVNLDLFDTMTQWPGKSLLEELLLHLQK